MPEKIGKDRKKLGNAIISNKVKDYSNDPLVLKKVQESREFLSKHGFPKELIDKK